MVVITKSVRNVLKLARLAVVTATVSTSILVSLGVSSYAARSCQVQCALKTTYIYIYDANGDAVLQPGWTIQGGSVLTDSYAVAGSYDPTSGLITNCGVVIGYAVTGS